MDELKEKIARAIAAEDIPEMQWVELSHRPYLKLAQAALTAIEKAGYCAIKIETLEHVTELLVDTWSTAMRGDPEQEVAVIEARSAIDLVESRPTYAALADSATSFDPEKQFEKDREEG